MATGDDLVLGTLNKSEDHTVVECSETDDRSPAFEVDSPEILAIGGSSTIGSGVYGISWKWSAVQGLGWTVGVHGRTFEYKQGGTVGVLGSSRDGVGVMGESDNYIGVVGASGVDAGVYGHSARWTGVVGSTGSSTNYAGYFWGAVGVNGNFTVWGKKSAAVPHPDGSHRLLYSVESPESWFEDFGRARLDRGRAVVKLDRDFAAVVRTASYHVFLSPEGDSNGLYVVRRGKSAFEVREQHGGTGKVSFSYRVVALRADVSARRFAKVELPKRPTLPKAPRDRSTPAWSKRGRSKSFKPNASGSSPL